MENAARTDSMTGGVADFEGSLSAEDGEMRLHQRLALKKRVYEASDWEGFRQAVNTHKSYGEYIILKNN